jgi:hypothetical protein
MPPERRASRITAAVVLLGVALFAGATWWLTRDPLMAELRELSRGEIVEVRYHSPDREPLLLRDEACLRAIKQWLARARRPEPGSWPGTTCALTLRYREESEVKLRVSRMDGFFAREDARRYATIGFRNELFIAGDPPDTRCAITSLRLGRRNNQ